MNKIARTWKVNLPTPLSTSTRPILSRTTYVNSNNNGNNGKLSKITLQRIQERERIEKEKEKEQERLLLQEKEKEKEKEHKRLLEEKEREDKEKERIKQIEMKKMEYLEYISYKIIIDIVLTTISSTEENKYGIPLFTLRIPTTYKNEMIEEIIYQLEYHLQSIYELYQETGMICLSLEILIDRAKRHFLNTPIDIQKHISLQFEEFIMDDIADWDNSYLSFIYRRGNEIRHIHSFYK